MVSTLKTSSPARKPIFVRKTILLSAGALLLGYLALGVRVVPEDRWAVRDSRLPGVAPKLLEPGWHFLPRGIFALYLYQDTERDFTFGQNESLAARSPEGARVFAAGSLRFQVAEAGLISFHRATGGDVDDWLTERVQAAVEQLIARPEFLPIHRRMTPAMEEAGLDLLRSETDGAGMAPLALRFDRIGYAGNDLFGEYPRPATRRKVLWLAIDSFDWDLIRPLMDQGRMPHLKALLERGAWGNLQTVSPVLSPVIWTSVATGKRPEKHGIVDFVASDPSTGAVIPVTSTLRKTHAFWNIFSQAGLSVGVVAWWASFPAEPVEGFICTDRIAYQLFKDRIADQVEDDPLKTHPRRLFGEIAPLIRQPADVKDEELSRFIDLAGYGPRFSEDDTSRVNDLRTVLAATSTYDRIASKLFEEIPTDIRVVYFEAPDTASHLFMPFLPPPRNVPPEKVTWFGRVVPEIYAFQDELIGRYVERFADDDTLILLTSDHGFKIGDDRPDTDARIGEGRAADWHSREGIVLLAGKDIRQGARILGASVLDLVPTLLAMFAMPVAEDMDGKVLTAAIEESFLRRYPVRTVETYDLTERTVPDAPLALGESEQELLEKLTALGYIQQQMPTADINRGTIAMAAGNYEEAIQAFREALLSGSPMEIRLNLARAYRLNEQLDEAEEELEILREKGHEPAAVLTELSAVRREQERFDEADSLLDRALAEDPGYSEAYFHRARIHEKKRRWSLAEAAYRKVVELDPLQSEALNQIGVMLQRQGKIPEAIETMRHAIEANPDLPAPYNNLGLLYRRQKQPDRALEVLREGVMMAPGSGVLRNSLGSLHYDAGRVEEAIAEFEAAIEANPAYAEPVSNLVVIYQGLEDAEKSVHYLNRLIELEPDNGDARVSLALTHFRQQELDAGIRALEELLSEQPDHLHGRIALGEVHLRRGAYAEALAHFEHAAGIDGKIPRLWNSLGQCYLGLGKTDKALEAFRRSLRLNPDQPDVRAMVDEIG